MLGVLVNCDWLKQISAYALLIGLLVIVIAKPVLIAKCLFWLFRAAQNLFLPMNEISDFTKRIVSWLVVGVVAVPAFPFLLAMLLDNDWLKQVSWPLLLTGLAIAAIAILILLIRWLYLTVLFLFKTIRRFCYWLNFRRTILIVMGLVVLVLIFYAEEDVRGWWAWQKFKHEWEAKGERFDYASIIPPPVPDAENFALTPIVASCYEWGLTKDGKRITPFKTNVVNRMWMTPRTYSNFANPPANPPYGDLEWEKGRMIDLKAWQDFYRTLAAKTNEFPISVMPQSPAADVLLALSKYEPAMEELRQASALPYSRFPLDYNSDKPFATMLNHLSSLKACVETLRLREVAELENGQSDKALDDVKLSFRLIAATRNEPFLISHLVRVAEWQLVFQPVWEGLAKHKWSDAQLAVIEQELGKLDFLADSQQAMHGERNNVFTWLDYFRRIRPYHEFRQMFAPVFMSPGNDEERRRIEREKTYEAIIMCLIPSGWYYQDKLVIGKTYQQWSLQTTDPAKHLAFPDVAQNGQKFEGSLHPGPWNVFARRFSGGFETTNRKLIYAQEMTDLARIAYALERFHLAHGQYPDVLVELTPQYIENIPHDIIGGQPLHYRRTEDGKYLLYSIGWDEKDDGGKISLSESGYDYTWLGDWVWPFPERRGP